jgi:hypothetical protein
LRLRAAFVCAVALLGADLLAQSAPVTIDRVVARVNDEIVQSLDVRQARLLKLFGPDVATDDAVLEHVINRRLALGDAARYPVPEPSPADVASRRQRWEASLVAGSGTALNLLALLQDAGMTETGLSGWFRDDARIETFENQRFTSAPATRDELLTYVRDHEASFPQPGGRLADVDDPAVQAKARSEIASAKRAVAVADWIDSLRKRAQIQIIR